MGATGAAATGAKVPKRAAKDTAPIPAEESDPMCCHPYRRKSDKIILAVFLTIVGVAATGYILSALRLFGLIQ